MTQLMTIREAAEFLKVSRSYLYQATRRGEVPVMRLGRSLRFSRETLSAWIESRMKGDL